MAFSATRTTEWLEASRSSESARRGATTGKSQDGGAYGEDRGVEKLCGAGRSRLGGGLLQALELPVPGWQFGYPSGRMIRQTRQQVGQGFLVNGTPASEWIFPARNRRGHLGTSVMLDLLERNARAGDVCCSRHIPSGRFGRNMC